METSDIRKLRAQNPTLPAALGAILLFAASFAPSLCAQTNATKPALPSNRFLFLVDTSHSMARRSDGVLKVMEDMIASGVGGQLRRGDSLAIWTYDAELHAGRFPLQRWTPDDQKTIAVRILSFMKGRQYEKQHDLPKALMETYKVIKASEFITVILISDGEQPMQGTPFDEQINHLYKLWEKEQQKARMPFVTVLRAAKGTITHFSVTSAPWPVEMPPLSEGLLVAATSQTNAAAQTKTPSVKKPPVPMAAPLIISGKKPPATAPQTPASPTPDMVALKPASAASNNPAVAGRAENIAPAQSGSTLARAAVPVPIVEPPAFQIETQAATQLAPPPVTTQPAAPLPAAQNLATPQLTESAGASAQTLQPAAATNLASGPETQNGSPGTEVPTAAVEHATNSPSTKPDSAAQHAVAVPAQPGLNPISILIVGLIFGGIGFGLIMISRRRSRAVPQSSLITRSLDRDRKP